ncbi:hypothetical protein LEMLEM_LOCUS25909, partial [Lemmus lemmus]
RELEQKGQGSSCSQAGLEGDRTEEALEVDLRLQPDQHVMCSHSQSGTYT